MDIEKSLEKSRLRIPRRYYVMWGGTEPVRKEIYFIKTDDGIVAGYIYLDIQGEILEIPIAVKKEFTGKGYAKQAILQGMELARGLGFKKAVGKIREDNIASMKLYIDKCGWVKTDEYVDFYSEELKRNVKMFTVYKDLV